MILRAPYIPAVALLAGAIGGGIFRDLYAGPVIGAVVGLVIGLVVMALTLPLRHWRKDASRGTAGKLVILLFAAALSLGATKLMYAPPPALLFNRVVMTPRPSSVRNIRAHIEYAGRSAAYALAFRIDRADLDHIIEQHGLEPMPSGAAPIAQDEPLLADPPPWWRSVDPSDPAVEAYLLADRYNEAYEATDPVDRLLLYDRSSHQARFLLADFTEEPNAATSAE